MMEMEDFVPGTPKNALTQKKERFFGCHVSTAGGLENGLKNGEALGVNTIQIHAVPPQRWNSKPAAKGVEDAFLAGFEGSTVKRLFFHGIYLINLATADSKNLKLSILSLTHSMQLLERMGGEAVIFHLGSLKDLDEDTGFKQAAEAIDEALREAPGKGKLLLEVAAGSGSIVGDRMCELSKIFGMLKSKDRVGFALDTQHLWASGYNLKDNLEEVVSEVEREFGLDKVGAIHLNDSKTELGSRKDRHENLGDGLIGKDALRAVFLHPKLTSIPFILETPAMKDLKSAKDEVVKLKSWL